MFTVIELLNTSHYLIFFVEYSIIVAVIILIYYQYIVEMLVKAFGDILGYVAQPSDHFILCIKRVSLSLYCNMCKAFKSVRVSIWLPIVFDRNGEFNEIAV